MQYMPKDKFTSISSEGNKSEIVEITYQELFEMPKDRAFDLLVNASPELSFAFRNYHIMNNRDSE